MACTAVAYPMAGRGRNRGCDDHNSRDRRQPSPRHDGGWGEDPRQVEAVIRDDPEALSMYREAMKCVNQYDLPDNNVIRLDTPQGNSRAYSIDRVQRLCDTATVAALPAGAVRWKSRGAIVPHRGHSDTGRSSCPKTGSKFRVPDHFGRPGGLGTLSFQEGSGG